MADSVPPAVPDTRLVAGVPIALLRPRPPICVSVAPAPALVIDIICDGPVIGRLDLGYGPFDGEARPGCFVVRPAHRPTSIESNSRGVSLMSVTVSDERVRAFGPERRLDAEFLHGRVHHDPLVFQLARRLWEDAGPGGGGGGGDDLYVDHALNTLLALALRRATAAVPEARPPVARLSARQLSAVLGYLDDNLDRQVRLDDLAGVAHVSRFHFARLFRQATGQPPYQYLIGLRVERAKALLRSRSGLTLAQVAAACGFYDQSQFTRHFRRLVGVTPKRFG